MCPKWVAAALSVINNSIWNESGGDCLTFLDKSELVDITQ
jgi:hypothetical protein